MRTRKKLKRAAEVAVVESLMAIARVLPRRLGQALFSGIGGFAGRCFRKDRRRAIENLGAAFPEMPAPFCRALASAMFRVLGRNAYEFLRLSGGSPASVDASVARVEGMEHLLDAGRDAKGIIAITGHIGCWELMPAYFSGRGYKVSVIARRMKVSRLNERLIAIRRQIGVESIDRDVNPRRMLEPLRRNEALGVLIDQHTRVAGIWVPFFGRPAYTPTAVAKIALATGAPILPMAIFLGRDGRHVIHVLPPIRIGTRERGDRDTAVREITERCSLAVEQLIRIDPKQWVWFHHRWRGRETGSEGAKAVYAAEA
ncbi:MAG TPA: lysophospholipid acyltransferase family protein [Candidatus Krumholzibacteria bacterium]|nr:lysophospholipid acyltransferase family protein [Candidatus Krumholzibacteria bacterium]